MHILRILAFVFVIPGIFTVFAARWLVSRYKLDKSVKCDFENEMDDEEIMRYKYNKAVVNVKMLGMLVALPGFILIILTFK